ncbi:hypothetical protein HYU09_01605 [Candidatus Woesearchaeota archaeon]|nr:hypothetical protein [Candidatus Woesearchaeota archaeon]
MGLKSALLLGGALTLASPQSAANGIKLDDCYEARSIVEHSLGRIKNSVDELVFSAVNAYHNKDVANSFTITIRLKFSPAWQLPWDKDLYRSHAEEAIYWFGRAIERVDSIIDSLDTIESVIGSCQIPDFDERLRESIRQMENYPAR